MNTNKTFREPDLFHGACSVTSVINDAVKNSNYPFYGAIRQEFRSARLPNFAQLHNAESANLNGHPTGHCDIKTTTNK